MYTVYVHIYIYIHTYIFMGLNMIDGNMKISQTTQRIYMTVRYIYLNQLVKGSSMFDW